VLLAEWAARLVKSAWAAPIRSFSDCCGVSVSLSVDRFVAFIRAGYPQGVPQRDYRPLLALLRRRLCDDELVELAGELVAHGELKLNIDIADIGVAITRITDELPSAADLERVQHRLRGDWLVR
jgi:hypothetical protein